MKKEEEIKKILAFIFITYSISAIGYYLWFNGFELASLITVIAPTTSYCILIFFIHDTKRICFLKASIRGILLGILIPMIYISMSIGIFILLKGKLDLNKINMKDLLPLMIQWIFAGICEEVGWRGFLLPTLKKITKPYIACIICGFIWSSWHYPMIINKIIMVHYQTVIAFLLLTMEAILITFIMNALGNLTGDYIWTYVILHACQNIFMIMLIPAIENMGAMYLDDGSFLFILALFLTTICVYLVPYSFKRYNKNFAVDNYIFRE